MSNKKRYDYRNTPEGKWRFKHTEVYQETVKFQEYLQMNGIAWHNPFADECTDDFACCTKEGGYYLYFPKP